MIYFRKHDLEASFDFLQRALANYRATVGDHYYRTSQVCVKLAECHFRKQELEAAK